MYLTETSRPPFFPFRPFSKRSQSSDFHYVARSFDENVLRRLKLLSEPSISLSWLSKAVDFLSFVHSEWTNLISNLKSSPSGDSVDVYLNHSVKLLDVCNLITSETEKLRQHRLLVNFVLHLVEVSGVDRGVPQLEKLRRARVSLSGWEKGNSTGTDQRSRFQIHDPETLIQDLASELVNPPHGKISSVEKLIHRTIYAVGLVTVFVAGAVLSAVFGSPKMTRVRAPTEFLWADSFNSLELATCNELNRRISDDHRKGSANFEEIDDVAIRVKELCELIDVIVIGDKDKGEVDKERLAGAVNQLETMTKKFSGGLDSFANGVNDMFHAVLNTRNGLLESYSVGPDKCLK